MSIFDRNKNGEYVTRGEAAEYLQGLPTKDDAATVMRALEELDGRVNELENLARTLRRGGVPTVARTASTPVASRVSAGDALTKSDAEAALRSLREDGVREFRALNAKIEQLAARAGSLLVQRTSPTISETSDRNTVDYGAVAFGLAEIRNKVAGVVGEGAGREHAPYYREAVQYFADVFAKADPTFDADAFKRQAGVTGGNGESGNWTPSHP